MRLRGWGLVAGLLVAALVLSTGQAAYASEIEVDRPDEVTGLVAEPVDPAIQPFVYNGVSTPNPGWVVSITRFGLYTCAGSLVHAQWVLTAAHCVDDADSTFRINVGSDFWFEGTQRRLSAVYIHPSYDPSVHSSVDLAMVLLDAPVSGVTLPKLTTGTTWPVIDQSLLVMGWGETSDGSSVPSELQSGVVRVNSDTTGVRDDGYLRCNPTWVADSGYEDFCFGGDSWACSGDSGGPLLGRATPFATTGALDTIYGLTSFGDGTGCSTAFWDTVAQSIGVHISWIQGFYASSVDAGDEMFFYRDDGLYRYYSVSNTGGLGKPILAGDDYTSGWSAITSVDLDGDGLDEMFFYRDDGLYRYYDINSNGSLGTPIRSGDDYTSGWSAITSVDLDGDGVDEMFFYRDDGLYRYYDINSNGSLGTPIRSGDDYTSGWSAITAVDLDGDGVDEMFFYRDDGLYRYYDINSNASLGTPIRSGDDYTSGWSAITAVDLDGDGVDEMFFYRDDGLYRYYDINSNASLGTPIRSGDDYTSGWSAITAVELGG